MVNTGTAMLPNGFSLLMVSAAGYAKAGPQVRRILENRGFDILFDNPDMAFPRDRLVEQKEIPLDGVFACLAVDNPGLDMSGSTPSGLAEFEMVQQQVGECLSTSDEDANVRSFWSSNTSMTSTLLNTIAPSEARHIRDLLFERRRSFRTPFPVVRNLGGSGRRAKVELVDYSGMLAVCKTFRPGRERFLRREIIARTELAKTITEMPGLIDHGQSWVITPLYGDTLGWKPHAPRLVPLPLVQQLVRVLERLWEAGYAHLDFSMRNVLVDPVEGLKIIDCEFLHRYDQRPDRFEESYDIAGVPAGFDGDVPVDPVPVTYGTRMQRAFGLDLESARGGRQSLQRLKRAAHFGMETLPRAALRPLRNALFRRQSAPSAAPGGMEAWTR
jgi:hypothetical protein